MIMRNLATLKKQKKCDLIVSILWMENFIKNHETNLPAKKEKKEANTRISEAITYSRGKERGAEAKAERKKEASCIGSRLFRKK